jgi:hypothetical protein
MSAFRLPKLCRDALAGWRTDITLRKNIFQSLMGNFASNNLTEHDPTASYQVGLELLANCITFWFSKG